MSIRTNLGRVLLAWRDHNGITLKDAERITGIDHATWARIEDGLSAPSAETLIKLLTWMVKVAE